MAPSGSLLLISTPAPVGTATRIAMKVASLGLDVGIISHPILLTEGCAGEGLQPARPVALRHQRARGDCALEDPLPSAGHAGTPVIVTSRETAELVREASTAFVATKISFINEMAALCEQVEADACDLSLALGLDKRIGPRCLQAGVGLGGTFVESDIASLSALAQRKGIQLKMLAGHRPSTSSTPSAP